MNGNASLRDVDVGEDGADDVAGARADDRERGPLLGDRRAVHPQLRPLGLQPLLHPVEDLRRAAGGGEDEEAVLGQAQHRAVVDHHPVDPAHDAVADRADLQVAHQVRVEHVEQHGGVGALHVDLAERGAVEDADAGARRGALAQHRGLHVLTGLRVEARALPLADVLEDGPGGDVPVVQGGDPLRVEQPPAVAAGQGGEGHRRVRGPERGGPGVLHRDPEQLGGDPGGDDAGGLALVVRGADGRVALDVLDGAQAGADGTGDVGDRRVALQVDELGAPARTGRVRHPPQHQRCGAGAPASGAAGSWSSCAGSTARAVNVSRATRCPSARHPARSSTPAAAPATARPSSSSPGTKAPRRLVVAQPAAGLAEQVHRGVPPAADQEQIARDRLDGRPDLPAQERGDERVRDPLDAAGTGHDASPEDRDPRSLALVDATRRHRRPGVDHGLHPHTGAVQVERGVVGAVVRGEDDGLAARQHAVAVQERAGGAGEHDARDGRCRRRRPDARGRPSRRRSSGPGSATPAGGRGAWARPSRGGRCAARARGRSRRRSCRRRWCAAGAAPPGTRPARRPRRRPSRAPGRRRAGRCRTAARHRPRTARRRGRRGPRRGPR